MQQQCVAFMGKLFENDHAEAAPPLGEDLCGVPPTKTRSNQGGVSSAKHAGISLNDVLLTGPNLNNSLLEVLMWFQKEKVAILANIQQMFHCFQVKEDYYYY